MANRRMFSRDIVCSDRFLDMPSSAQSDKKNMRKLGITEDTNTWSGWKKLGYEVIHGSRALFGCSLIWGSKGDGVVYNARFFGKSQVQAIV